MNRKSDNIFVSTWRFLVEPATSVIDVGDRRRALLTSVISLLLLLSFFVALIATGISGRFDETSTYFLLYSVPIILASYTLSRTRFYTYGSFLLTIALLFVTVADVPLLINEQGLNRGVSFLNTMILFSIVLSSTILRTRNISIVALISIGTYLYLLFPYMGSFRSFIGDFGVILTIAILIIVTSGYRSYTEQEQINEIKRTNEELRSASVELEQRVEERTKELNRRSTLLEAAAFVSRQASGIQELGVLLDQVVDLISERFGFYHAGIFLADPNQQNVVLQSASSEGGKRMLQRGHRLEIGRQGIVGYAAYLKSARIAQDVGSDNVYFNNPDLPNTHSELALPLIAQNRLIGILDIQSEQFNAFGPDDIFTLQTMADQIALAIENARLLNESREALSQSRQLMVQGAKRSWQQALSGEVMRFTYTPVGISQNVREATDSDSAAHELRVPINLRGQQIGELILRRKESVQPWDEKELEMAEKISDQAALALENARLLQESQRQAAQAQALNDISDRFSQSLDIETLLQNAAKQIHQLPQVSEASILLAPPSSKKST